MSSTARLMNASEVDLIIDYFTRSTPEHLETLGVDPTRFPSVEAWRQRYEREFALSPEQRTTVMRLFPARHRSIRAIEFRISYPSC